MPKLQPKQIGSVKMKPLSLLLFSHVANKEVRGSCTYKHHQRFTFNGVVDLEMYEAVKKVLKEKQVKDSLKEYRVKMRGCIFHEIHIVFDKKMKSTGGCAHYVERMLKLNYRLLKLHPEELRETVLHELAHFITHAKHVDDDKKVEAHGDEFRAVLFDLGGNGETYHDMDISSTSRKKFKIWCGCMSYQVTKERVEDLEGVACKKCNIIYSATDPKLKEKLIDLAEEIKGDA